MHGLGFCLLHDPASAGSFFVCGAAWGSACQAHGLIPWANPAGVRSSSWFRGGGPGGQGMGAPGWRPAPPWGKVEAKLKVLGLDPAGAIRSGSHHKAAVLYQFEPGFCPPGEMMVLAYTQ